MKCKGDSPILWAKQPSVAALLSLKIPPQAAMPGLPLAAPSELHGGGCQLICLMDGALPAFPITESCFRIKNSETSEGMLPAERLPVRETFAIIKLIAADKGIDVSLKRSLFMHYQIAQIT